jgi:hypothetical protein
MCNFLIGGRTGAGRSLAVYLFDPNSLCRQPSLVRHLDSIRPCVVSAASSSNHGNHFDLHSKREDFAWPLQ